MGIKEQLDQLADIRLHKQNIEREKQELLENTIPVDVRILLNDIEAEFAGKLEAVDAKIAELEAQVKDAVVFEGETVKGEMLMAVYNKGRVSWDAKKLDALGTMIPQILSARKEGEPSVSIRWM